MSTLYDDEGFIYYKDCASSIRLKDLGTCRLMITGVTLGLRALGWSGLQ